MRALQPPQIPRAEGIPGNEQRHLHHRQRFQAAALLLHLDDKGVDGRRITIIGRGELGTGQAFGCVNDDFRLNVRAELMRVWPDRPLEFTHWARERITDDPEAASEAGDFYRRRDFAVYMTEQLDQRAGTKSARRVEAEAVALTPHRAGWQVALDDGSFVCADQVVLATGNPSPDWPFRGDVSMLPRSGCHGGATGLRLSAATKGCVVMQRIDRAGYTPCPLPAQSPRPHHTRCAGRAVATSADRLARRRLPCLAEHHVCLRFPAVHATSCR